MSNCGRNGGALLLSVLLSFIFISCVDVNKSVIGPVDYFSSAKFVNLANVSGASMNVAVDGSSVATISYGGASAYHELSSGSRVFAFSYGGSLRTDTLRQALTSELKYTVFSIYDAAAGDKSPSYVFVTERYTYEAPSPTNAALVRFLNLSSDTSAAISGGLEATLSYGGKDSSFSGIIFKTGTSYDTITTSKFPVKFTVIDANGSTLLDHVDSKIQSVGRYSIVVYGPGSNFQNKVLKED